MELIGEAKAWLKRKSGPDEVIRVVLAAKNGDAVTAYKLYTAFDEQPEFLGRVLFDRQNYWIYDGDVLTVSEQEQVAKFILNYVEVV